MVMRERICPDVVWKSLITCCGNVYDQLWWLLGIAMFLLMCTYNNNYHSSILMTLLRNCIGGCVGIQLASLGIVIISYKVRLNFVKQDLPNEEKMIELLIAMSVS